MVFLMKRCKKLMFITTCVLVVLGAHSISVFSYDFPVEAPPSWLKVGTYVEYEGGMPLEVVFLNGTEMGGKKEKFIFRWECLAMSSQVATLNLTLDVPLRLHISKIINITTNTREILYPNGTVMGKACLWLPPNPKTGDLIVVSGKSPNQVTAEVRTSGGSAHLTCQGYQECYWAHNVTMKREGNFDRMLVHVVADFDLDTGLLVAGYIGYTTTVNYLGLCEMGLIRLLRATNVDLGPRYLRTEVLTFLWNTLPIWLPATIFIIALVVMIRKRRKRRHLSKTRKEVQ
jgi:hypothetical protein